MRYETPLTTLLREHDAELLRVIAKERGISISTLIRHIITDWMNARYCPYRKAVDDHFGRLQDSDTKACDKATE